jgi:hypothetical protein
MNPPLDDQPEAVALVEQERRRDQERRDRQKRSHLNRLLGALRSIAKGLGLDDPKIEAERIKRRLSRDMAQHEAALVRDLRYHARIEPWRRRARPNERWARHLVRLENERRKIGRKRGTQRLNRKEANKLAIENAAAVKPEELNPVERRAVELLMGKKQKSRKNPIEKRAIDLVESVKRVWGFQSKRKSKVRAERSADWPILSITDVISIAAPIIEEFAQGPIAFRKRGSDTIPPSFEALYSIVCAYARNGEGCKKSTVDRLLKSVRNKREDDIDDEKVQVYIAPELRGWLE